MEANEVVLKKNRIQTETHYIEHSDYLSKDNSTMIYQSSEVNSLEIINIQRQRIAERKGRRGRPPAIAHDLIFSIPKDIEELIKDYSDKELKNLFDIFLDTLLRDISKSYPKADIKFLRKNLQVYFHRDSDHLHFHCQIPAFTKDKGLFNNKIIPLDFGNRNISGNMRRIMFSTFKRLQGLKVEEMTIEDFRKKSWEAKAMNEKKSKSWKQRKANIKLSEAEIAERQKDIDKLKARNDALNAELTQKIDRSSKLYASSLKLLERAETQLNNGNTKLAEKQLKKVSESLKSDIVKSGIKT
jgi:hypothetical protein